MKLIRIFSALLLSSLPYTTTRAAGGAVSENFVPLLSLTANMITACKRNETENFMKSASQALKLTAENKNNSIVLPRVSARFRAAKAALNKGQIDNAINALQSAENEMLKIRTLTWDGGSE